ncbi:hypothetical protein BwSH20_13410 [Bradyrhizobium ottawaense]|nr:hypothetical protein SG09_36380 [Bradyrhizobium ottawaense]GMO14733.1 hypothetical protein BwSF21_03410 [Bradyrhizobium ottawaense]GMO16944.1 hypothetical protein BwSF12_02750 [Bradyrhizobium ottawaense]GMO40663.1 hypothetical protein BwSH14_52050 [Bradyrhizobium ottawaense]GMO60158.1 hypothetical protein BwSG10_06890 [Bradyrhizobium ottawaense]
MPTTSLRPKQVVGTALARLCPPHGAQPEAPDPGCEPQPALKFHLPGNPSQTSPPPNDHAFLMTDDY